MERVISFHRGVEAFEGSIGHSVLLVKALSLPFFRSNSESGLPMHASGATKEETARLTKNVQWVAPAPG